jgi:predicted ester cyclase
VDVEANKALVRRFYEEVWARGNVAFTQEVFADDYVRHDLRPTKAPPGAAGQAFIAEQFRRAFPDLQWRIDLVLGDGDFVAARWTASGTHSGGWGDIAPTGRRATFSGVNIFRFGDEGKVVEIWNHRDDFGLREQLGAPVFAGAQPQAEER